MVNPKYIPLCEIFRNATTIHFSESVRRKRQRDQPITTSEAYRNAGFRGENYSCLSRQVVGAENKMDS